MKKWFVLLPMLFIVFVIYSCKKKNEVDPNFLKQPTYSDTLQSTLTIMSQSKIIIDKAIEVMASNNNSLDTGNITKQLRALKGVDKVNISTLGNEINITKSDGVVCCLNLFSPSDTRLRGTITNNGNSTGIIPAPNATNPNAVFPTSKKAIILAPYQHSFNEDIGLISFSLSNAGYSVDIYSDDLATLDKFKGDYLAQYGVIIILAHGNYDARIKDSKIPCSFFVSV